jgi:hypothetical protein
MNPLFKVNENNINVKYHHEMIQSEIGPRIFIYFLLDINDKFNSKIINLEFISLKSLYVNCGITDGEGFIMVENMNNCNCELQLTSNRVKEIRGYVCGRI